MSDKPTAAKIAFFVVYKSLFTIAFVGLTALMALTSACSPVPRPPVTAAAIEASGEDEAAPEACECADENKASELDLLLLLGVHFLLDD